MVMQMTLAGGKLLEVLRDEEIEDALWIRIQKDQIILSEILLVPLWKKSKNFKPGDYCQKTFKSKRKKGSRLLIKWLRHGHTLFQVELGNVYSTSFVVRDDDFSYPTDPMTMDAHSLWLDLVENGHAVEDKELFRYRLLLSHD